MKMNTLTNIVAVGPTIILLGVIIGVTIKRGFGEHTVFGHKHGESVFSVDQYAHESRLAQVNPSYKIIISITLLIITVVSNNFYVSCFIIVFCAFVTVVLGGLSLGKYINLLTIPLIFMITGTVIILIEFSSKIPLESLAYVKLGFFYIYITNSGLHRVLILWGRAFGAISAMYMMSLSTPTNELFSSLSKAHCPSLITELMNMMYRFIFTMMDTQIEMNNAAQSRLGYRNYRTALNTFGHIGSNLLIVSLKKANDYYNALESRLYNGRLSFLVDEKKVTPIQVGIAIILFLYIALVFIIT